MSGQGRTARVQVADLDLALAGSAALECDIVAEIECADEELSLMGNAVFPLSAAGNPGRLTAGPQPQAWAQHQPPARLRSCEHSTVASLTWMEHLAVTIKDLSVVRRDGATIDFCEFAVVFRVEPATLNIAPLRCGSRTHAQTGSPYSRK